MSETKITELSEMLEKLGDMKHETPEDCMKIYAEFGPYCNEFVAKLEYWAPRHVAKVLSDVTEKHDHSEKSSMTIIDFADGTGLVCKQLKEMGFKGAIDAQDGSDAMLAIASPLYIH